LWLEKSGKSPDSNLMEIKVVNESGNPLPSYATANAAGMDLRASIGSPISIKPMERVLVGTKLFIEIPVGYEAQIRPRSGLAANHGITVLNAPGTIDADYRGEIKVILINLSDTEFTIKSGDRIAQMIISRHERCSFTPVEKLVETSRGSGGFGHTGSE